MRFSRGHARAGCSLRRCGVGTPRGRRDALRAEVAGAADRRGNGRPQWSRLDAAHPCCLRRRRCATFAMPPGYRLELVASEPLIQDPILIDWDPAGRLWAIELPGYMRDIKASGEYEPIGRIVVLEDTNGDGAMDRRTVFADGLIQPRAMKVLEQGVLVGEPPNIWLMRDTNGDLRSDAKSSSPPATAAARPTSRSTPTPCCGGSTIASTWRAPAPTWCCGSSTARSRSQRSLSRGQWGATQDDAGRVYRNHNESVLHVDLVPTPYFARNPALLRTRGSHEALQDPAGNINDVWPAHQTPGTNRAYQHGILRADGTLAAYHRRVRADRVSRRPAAAGRLRQRLRRRADRERRQPVHPLRRRDDAASAKGVSTGRVPQLHRRAVPAGLPVERARRHALRGRHLPGHHSAPRLHHRIPAGSDRQPRARTADRPWPDLPRRARQHACAIARRCRRNAGVASSSASLSHPNGWWRDTAQRLLVERGDQSVAPALTTLAETAPDWRTRVHALWTLDGLNAVTAATVAKALADSSRDVRVAALRISERWLGEEDHPLQSRVVALAEDQDWAVRQQAAASMGALPPGTARAIDRRGARPPRAGSDHADTALSGLRGTEAAVLDDAAAARSRTNADARSGDHVWRRPSSKSGQESAVIESVPADCRPCTSRLAARGPAARSGGRAGGRAQCPGRPAPGRPAELRDDAVSDVSRWARRPRRRVRVSTSGRLAASHRSIQCAGAPADARAEAADGSRRQRMAISSARAAALLGADHLAGQGRRRRRAARADRRRSKQQFDRGREVYRNICQAVTSQTAAGSIASRRA